MNHLKKVPASTAFFVKDESGFANFRKGIDEVIVIEGSNQDPRCVRLSEYVLVNGLNKPYLNLQEAMNTWYPGGYGSPNCQIS